MVFTRDEVIYDKENPALYSSNGIQAVNSVSLTRNRLRRDQYGKLTTPANSWVCRIDSDYHLLPRGKKTAGSAVVNSLEISNSQLLNAGDPLTLLEPHLTLDTATLTTGSTGILTVDGISASYSIVAGAITARNQIVDFINKSPLLSTKVYAIAAPISPSLVHVFAKGLYRYSVQVTGGMVSSDAALVVSRPIGTVLVLANQANIYNLVTVTPSTAPGAIAVADIPLGAVVDSPIYHEIVGLFNSTICFDQIAQYMIAPIHGANGMNVFALSHFDETLRQQFPKITFIENRI